jgi:hypothetical protein
VEGLSNQTRRRFFILLSVLTLLFEGATIAIRVSYGHTAEEFNRTYGPPLVVKMHHLFWSIPFVIVAGLLKNWQRTYVLWAIAGALVLSDLMHHFVVLPLWVGNTGWHWP